MLARKLQDTIDERWDACWPTSKLRPIVILDLVSYLFFVRKISRKLQSNKEPLNRLVFSLQGPKGREEIKSDFFSDLGDENIHSLFASENGIAELEKEYSQHAEYGSFFKSGLLMMPTSKLLENALAIIKIIEGAHGSTKVAIFEYLLGKTELIGPNGNAYLPEYLVKLLVNIIRPGENDFILDPSIGNGSLLVGCAKYIDNRNLKPFGNNDGDFESQKLKGMESDVTSLRIAAMNLMLHGLHPELKVLDIFSPLNSVTTGDATVIVTNLIFLPGENNRNVEANAGRDVIRKEIYYLDFILRNFTNGARCVVIVPDIILYQAGSEFVSIRQELVENYKLNSVISIEEKKLPMFNGAGILVFSKEISSTTDRVWFCKLRLGDTGFSPNLNSNNAKNILEQSEDFVNVLEHFRNEEEVSESGKGFYIHIDEMRAKNYNFSYNEYSSPAKAKPSGVHTITIKSTDFPKWESQSVRATSLLQPMSKARPGPTIDKPRIKSFDRQKLFNLVRKPFPSKVRYGLILSKAKATSLDWWRLFDRNRKTFSSKLGTRLAMNKPKVKSFDRQKLFNLTRKLFPSKAGYVLILNKAKATSLDWWRLVDRNRRTFSSKLGAILAIDMVKIKSFDSRKFFDPIRRKAFLSKKIISKKNGVKAVFLILVLVIGYLFYSFLFLQNNINTKDNTPVVTGAVSDSAKRNPEFSASSLHSIDSVVNTVNNDLLKNSDGNSKASFKVISKAYFYSSPALGNPEDLYITSINNDTLTAIKEQNGFVYVDYINSLGKNTKGWLNMNDLEAISSTAINVHSDKRRNQDLSEDVNDKPTEYVIRTKTYFYLKPDVTTRVDLYLSKPNHTQLIPLKEENGFVYVVYTNTKGKSTHGWLSKSDLVAVKK